MTIEEAIRSALEYETQVRDTYAEAAEKAVSAETERFFKLMTREEQGHIDYLNAKLDEWQRRGVLSPEAVGSALAVEGWVRAATDGLEVSPGDERADALEYLYAVLRLEEKVSGHYRELVATVDHPEAASMFSRFLEIEDGHIAIVQTEIDFQSGTGIFYGVQEFTLDG